MSKLFSFDIFDTCITRKCGTPDNFFDILSEKVFCEKVNESVKHEFILARKSAEQKAYNIKKRATIYDIYNQLSFYHPQLLPKQQLVKAEIELERNVIIPVYKIKEQIKALHDSHQRVIFISDMYLPSSILKPILIELGIMQDADGLYISCEIGKTKCSGEIYPYIQDLEKIHFRNWIHTGDNKIADYQVPKNFGIKVVLINHKYSSYSQHWLDIGNKSRFNYSGILAGLSRAHLYAEPENNRKLLLLDIIGPLYCSFVYNIFVDAERKGISRLYFCARDTYQIFQIAQIINQQFPEIEIQYLRISREVLQNESNEVILSYFCQEGLASKKISSAMVDTTTSGRTLDTINQLLSKNGYRKIFGYYILKYDDQNIEIEPQYYFYVIRQYYLHKSKIFLNIFSKSEFALIIENIFSTNIDRRTIGYQSNNGTIIPIFCEKESNQDCMQVDKENWQNYYTHLLEEYAQSFIQLGLHNYSKEILNNIAIHTLCNFFIYPQKQYVRALEGCYQCVQDTSIPYISKESFIRLLKTRGRDTKWKRGTLAYNLPEWLLNFRWNKK